MKKVALVGTAPGSRLLAPYDDQSWEIWVCSAGNSQAAAVPRVTKWFEIHAICDMIGAENKHWSLPYYAWLKSQTFTVYMQEKNDYVPQAIPFPYKRYTEEFGPNAKKRKANWFTSSVAWMFAKAITESVQGDQIGIFGVDMAALEENYTAQKAGLQRFAEIAFERGIDVSVPYESCLMKNYPLYGYAEATHMGRKLAVRMDEMRRIRAQVDAQCKQYELQRAFFDGALEAVQYDIRTWTDGMDAELDEQPVGQAEFAGRMLEASKPPPTTGQYTQSEGGVYMPPFAKPPQPPSVPISDALPEGSTITVRADGKKDYGMAAEPARFAGGPHGKAKPNGPLPEIGE